MQNGTYRVTAVHPRTKAVLYEEEVIVESGRGITEEALIASSTMAAQLEGKMGATTAAIAQWTLTRVS